jgi:Txe/YoeB family toxin of toxin-antitoxin system
MISKKACKEFKNIAREGLRDKVEKIISVIEEDPYRDCHSFEKLTGNLKGKYSRRINIKHRLVYQVDEELKQVKILSIWTHYETAHN